MASRRAARSAPARAFALRARLACRARGSASRVGGDCRTPPGGAPSRRLQRGRPSPRRDRGGRMGRARRAGRLRARAQVVTREQVYGRRPVREALRGPREVLELWATERALGAEAWLRDAPGI